MPRVARISATPAPLQVKSLTSRHTPLVKELRALARGRAGVGSDEVIIEGERLVLEALASNVPLDRAVLSTARRRTTAGRQLEDQLGEAGVEVLEASEAVLAAISPVRTPSGVLAVARLRYVPLGELLNRAPQLLVFLLDVQDPGNVGAIIRTAEAAGASGVVVCGAAAAPFGWKVIRGSMGSVFRLPIATASVAEAFQGAGARGIRLLAATAEGRTPYLESDLAGPTAFLVGGEGAGVPVGLLSAADGTVSVPMSRPVDSLNVAVATALLLYEARRQRESAHRPHASPATRRSPGRPARVRQGRQTRH